jgi:hypothetical protein
VLFVVWEGHDLSRAEKSLDMSLASAAAVSFSAGEEVRVFIEAGGTANRRR